jgi:ABC-type polysaccharide/polyol phosphate transport system ATPase subunit
VIELQGASKVFSVPHRLRHTLLERVLTRHRCERFEALRDVSLRVERGEFLGLVGRNGSGKSTLLRLVAGIYPATSGRVQVDGEVAPILDLGVGFQRLLAVRDNVRLYGTLLGIEPQRLRGAGLDAVLADAGVERFADAPLATLSTGLVMRLAYSLALRTEAPNLLIDEALTVGDEHFRRRSLEELRALRGRGQTAIVVSHDRHILEALCDRLALLDAGRLVLVGTPAEVAARYGAP